MVNRGADYTSGPRGLANEIRAAMRPGRMSTFGRLSTRPAAAKELPSPLPLRVAGPQWLRLAFPRPHPWHECGARVSRRVAGTRQVPRVPVRQPNFRPAETELLLPCGKRTGGGMPPELFLLRKHVAPARPPAPCAPALRVRLARCGSTGPPRPGPARSTPAILTGRRGSGRPPTIHSRGFPRRGCGTGGPARPSSAVEIHP